MMDDENEDSPSQQAQSRGQNKLEFSQPGTGGQAEKPIDKTFMNEDEEIENPHYRVNKESATALDERIKQIEEKRKELEQKMKEQQSENAIESYQKDDKKEILERVKQIYYSLPKKDDEVLKYPLDWDALHELNVIDAVMTKIVSRRVKDILDVEEPSLIRWVLDALKKKPTPQYLKQNLYGVLDDATDGFVVSIWKAMIFENMKFDQQIIKEPFKIY